MRLLVFPEDTWRLRRKALEFPNQAFGTSEIRSYGEALYGVMQSIGGAAAIAGPQVDIDPAWRMVVIKVPGGGCSLLCNPEIVSHSGSVMAPEACLSFASVYELAEAPEKLTVRYRRMDGSTREVECLGNDARVIWHETRHLDGQLMIDDMGTMQKRLFLNKVRKARMRAAVGET